MCQACWVLASRRSGAASEPSPFEPMSASAAPRPRLAAAADWADEPKDEDPMDDERDAGAASGPPSPSVDATRD